MYRERCPAPFDGSDKSGGNAARARFSDVRRNARISATRASGAMIEFNIGEPLGGETARLSRRPGCDMDAGIREHQRKRDIVYRTLCTQVLQNLEVGQSGSAKRRRSGLR